VTRDGLGLECYRQTEAGEEFMLEVFRNDHTGAVSLLPSAAEIPFSLVSYLAKVVPEQLGGHKA
jgi:hypothetical protein